jgi:hypothetical protein
VRRAIAALWQDFAIEVNRHFLASDEWRTVGNWL